MCSRCRAGLWLPDEKPMYGAQPILGHPLTPTAAWLFNEGGGNKIFDLGGNNLNGTLVGNEWGNNGFTFDGINDEVSIADNTLMEFGSNYTIRCKFKIISTSATTWEVVFGRINNSGNISDWSWAIYYYVADYNISFGCGSGVSFDFLTNAFIGSLNTMYDVIITANGSTVDLYVNGVYRGQDASQGVTQIKQTGNPFYIARGGDNVDNKWSNIFVEFAECRNYSITPSQVAQLYYGPYCWLAQPMGAELMYAPPAVGAIMNQFQRTNLGADLYDGVLIT